MMRQVLLAFAILASVSIFAAVASAQDAAPPASGFPKPVVLSGMVKGNGKFTSGGCTQGFSNQCPSGHTCMCFTMDDGKFNASQIGSGRANVFATIDTMASFGALGHDCMPLYGEIDVLAKNDSPTFDVWGAVCTQPSGNLVANGALGLESSSLFTASGYATFTSTLIKDSGHLVLKFVGAAQ